MMKKKIAIIGAGYLQKPLVEKANSLGLETLCFAWIKGAVCKDICSKFYPISIIEKEQICNICITNEVSGVVSIASDVAVPTVAYIASQMGLVGNSVSSAYYATNKGAMRKILSESLVNSPDYKLVSEIQNVGELVGNLSYPVIVKPVDRSGSLGVSKVLSPPSLKSTIGEAITLSLSGEAIIEQFIDGQEVSVEYISWEGKHFFLAITDKVTSKSPYYVELEHHQPSSFSDEIYKKITHLTEASLDALGIEFGASHSEFIVSKDGEVFVTEIGARMGGDFIGSRLVELSTGYDFLKGVIDVSLGNFAEPEIKQSQFAGIYFLSNETKYLLSYFEDKNKFSEILEYELFAEMSSNLRSSSDRNGYFIYQGTRKFPVFAER